MERAVGGPHGDLRLRGTDRGGRARHPGQLEAVAAAWREWGAREDGWFAVLHGEILCRKDA